MKKFTFIAIIGLLGFSGIAQEEEVADTTVIKLKNKKFVIKEIPCDDCDEDDKNSEDYEWKGDAHWAGIDVGVNTFLNSSGSDKFTDNKFLEIDPAKSWNWNLNFAEHRFSIVKQYVGITTGLGLNVSNFSFKDNYLYRYTPDSITAVLDTVVSYNKNKLRVAYLTIPLLLEFNTNKDSDKNFYISAGVVGGVNIMSKLKRNTDQEGYKSKFSEKGDYGVNPFKLDLMARVGFSNWGVYASYNLIPTLDKSLTESAHQASFGLTYSF